MSLAAPSMEYQGLAAYAELIPYRGRPAKVQSLEFTPGTLEATLFWTAPQNMEGVDGWNLYKDNETNLILKSTDPTLRQALVKLPGAGKSMFYVCACSKLGIEGPKTPVLVTSTTDLVVVTGTAGGTGGTGSGSTPGWTGSPSGGGGGRRQTK